MIFRCTYTTYKHNTTWINKLLGFFFKRVTFEVVFPYVLLFRAILGGSVESWGKRMLL